MRGTFNSLEGGIMTDEDPGRPRLHQERLRRHPLYRAMLENRRRAAVEEERARARAYLGYLLSFVFWTLLGCGLAAWGMHTTRVEYSRVAIEAGILLGLAGIVLTLVVAYDRSE